MEKFLKIVVTLAAIAIIVMVRLHRALESALWEICPGAMTWTRNVVDAAHKAVCQEQRAAIESRREAAAPKKKLKPAVKPIAELPSSFPSWEAKSKTWDVLRADWEVAVAERRAARYNTPEYTAADNAAGNAWLKLERIRHVPVAS
jgi:hypothetical protein